MATRVDVSGGGNSEVRIRRQGSSNNPGGSDYSSYYSSTGETERGSQMGRGSMTPEMPSAGRIQPSYMGSQSTAPDKSDD